jgi:hypothetical protein
MAEHCGRRRDLRRGYRCVLGLVWMATLVSSWTTTTTSVATHPRHTRRIPAPPLFSATADRRETHTANGEGARDVSRLEGRLLKN